MFTGDSVTKMGERLGGETKTEKPTYGTKSPSASKMIPSIIGEGLTITGNVAFKGEIQVDGEIQGDVQCGSLLLGDKSQITGCVIAEDVVVRGRVLGSIRGLRVTLQAQSHVEGDIYHQSLAVEQGAYFEGKSRRSDNPLEEVKASSAGRSRSVRKPSDLDSKPHDEASAPSAAELDATDNPGAVTA
jgi:cytoskeletal protein CcmA (bactofilin family)